MLGQDCTMMSCYNDILIVHVKILLIINGYMYTCRMIISSACMEESAAAMTVFNLYCSHNQITWLHNPEIGSKGETILQPPGKRLHACIIVVCANTFVQNQDN